MNHHMPDTSSLLITGGASCSWSGALELTSIWIVYQVKTSLTCVISIFRYLLEFLEGWLFLLVKIAFEPSVSIKCFLIINIKTKKTRAWIINEGMLLFLSISFRINQPIASRCVLALCLHVINVVCEHVRTEREALGPLDHLLVTEER